MHLSILDPSQIKLLPFLAQFSPQFGLVGGTAIALQLGHRRSIDFDLFTTSQLQIETLKQKLRTQGSIEHTFIESQLELSVLLKGVKLTFHQFPFHLNFTISLENLIFMPNLITLAAMKAVALGKRSKWKDYVDLYFLLQKLNLEDISTQANKIFGSEFNEKLFRVQLAYFKDIDYSEQVNFMTGFEVDNEVIKNFLEKKSIN